MTAADQIRIHEIYESIQGESTFAGLPCTFVRLSRCNLRCRWCDTPQAFEGGTQLPRAEVLEKALSFGTPLVELTGGEPLLQAGAIPLLRELCEAGRTVLLETSGERDISGVDPRVHRIMDLKAPGSDESHGNRWENIEHLTQRDEVKIVLADRADYDWAKAVIERHRLADRVNAVLLSCVWGELDPKDLVQWVLEDQLPVRVQIQMHKVIWDAETQGV
ncbi:MAG: 7-carboxy-7-deazaguanine synthase QueE [Deltaproteobacteria bacterium]|nr:radical SAM protein [Deltaproteobacteria bacterium]MBW2188825.1 radical SAM protein [Deltaproteobacteria bacterium]MBW2223391.1 radical SAM protein [Deltaproteobacteria bacterium]RLB50184.1 MAG: 7-carboxy-7-deazaguanine synthase QueE [Deltaproteobacteria bacterium]